MANSTTTTTTEDIAEVTQKTVEWAFMLGYSEEKSVKIAVRALIKKGLMGNLDFFPSWTMYLDLRGLGHLVTKYLPDGIREEAEKMV